MTARYVTVALVGFGSVSREFVRLLLATRQRLLDDHGLEVSISGVATRQHGMAINRLGLDLETLAGLPPDASLDALHCCPSASDTVEFIREAQADVVVEASVLDVRTGGPAVDHVRTALEDGADVISVNKGPVACAYAELRSLADSRGRQFRFEGTVMDGTPVFNLVADTLPGCEVIGFRGVLNSTTNLVISALEADPASGMTLDGAVADAQARGIAEADPSHDIDGHDAAAKTAALANVLMDARTTPARIPTEGVRGITAQGLAAHRAEGRRVRLVGRAARTSAGVSARVAPETLPDSDLLARLEGTSNALVLETDLMGEVGIVELDPGVEQTAYAVLSDLIAIARAGAGSR